MGLLKEIVLRLSRIAIFGIPGLNAPQFAATGTAVRALALEAEIMKCGRLAAFHDLMACNIAIVRSPRVKTASSRDYPRRQIAERDG